MFNRILKTLNFIFAFFGWPNFTSALMMFTDGDVITGAAGSLKQGNSDFSLATAVPILNVNVRVAGGTIQTTDSANTNGFHSKVPSKYKSWSGDAEAQIKEGETELVPNTEYDIHIVAIDSSGNECYWSGKAILTELGVAIPVVADDVVKRSLTFEGNGALTKTEN